MKIEFEAMVKVDGILSSKNNNVFIGDMSSQFKTHNCIISLQDARAKVG